VRITAAICVGALSLCVVQSYFWTYYAPTDKCRQRIEIRTDLTIVWTAWTWTTELLVFGAVPIVILIFNLFVIAEIRQTERRASQPCTDRVGFLHSIRVAGHEGAADSEGEGGKDGRGGEAKGWVKGPRRKSSHMGMNKSTTLMLLYVSFYVIVTTLPATLVYAIYHYFPEGDHSLTDDEIRADGTWRSLSRLHCRAQDRRGSVHIALRLQLHSVRDNGPAVPQSCCSTVRHPSLLSQKW
jgi:hypothetical protein